MSHDPPGPAHLSKLGRAAALALALLAIGCNAPLFRPNLTTDLFEGGDYDDSQVAIIDGCGPIGLHGLLSLTVDGKKLAPPEGSTRDEDISGHLTTMEGHYCRVRVLPGKHELTYRVPMGRVPDAFAGGEIDVKAGQTYMIRRDYCGWCYLWGCEKYAQTAWIDDEDGNVIHGKNLSQRRAQLGC